MADVKIKVPKRNKPPRGACRRGRGKFKKAIKGVAANGIPAAPKAAVMPISTFLLLLFLVDSVIIGIYILI